MLLTKPLTTFLSQNTSPQLPTLLLVSPDGKLLSSSSPLSASLLRTQSTAACSLWNIYKPFQTTSNLISSALSSQDTSSSAAQKGSDLNSITIQLAYGIMVIRALSCGLIFVAIGPTAHPHPSSSGLYSHSHTLLTPKILPTPDSPPSSPMPQHEGHEELGERVVSGAGSVTSSATGARIQASILGVKRQADEVGIWLEDKLQGFMLSSAEGR
ncbi:hypothetical protein BJ875DRAFT_380760 [Amylocarpus encephaloides]|uniref:Uncharacterized protein n=1 Tax=Amylocarpus encephaloides TaxID=45428 RepID=A0A9P7YG56_9HELO|nr:hypothetical protein BJ875DRAFT_380760 [Amylocarpus encephaloides]